jgi:septum formation topological specificity factor MinE
MWFETQDSINYWEDFLHHKIIFPNMTKYLPFFLDKGGFFTNQKCFIISGENLSFLCAFLNSPLFKYCFRDDFPTLLDGTRELSKIFFEKIRILPVDENIEKRFEVLVDSIQSNKANISIFETLQREINSIIYKMYDITPEQIDEIEFKVAQDGI